MSFEGKSLLIAFIDSNKGGVHLGSQLLEVEYSGYSENRGVFCDLYFINPDKTDYEIYFPDGDVFRQKSEFHKRCEDWNRDGDIYELFGAFFQIESLGRGEFFTPENMVRFITDDGGSIPGIEMKTVLGKMPAIDEKLKQAANMSECKAVERNDREPGYER